MLSFPFAMQGIKHKKNEVFLDAVESVNLLVNSNGTVVLSEVGCQPPTWLCSQHRSCESWAVTCHEAGMALANAWMTIT
jgi:hypothetical protein